MYFSHNNYTPPTFTFTFSFTVTFTLHNPPTINPSIDPPSTMSSTTATATATTSQGAAIRVAFEAVGNAVQSEGPVGCPLNGLVAEAIVNEDAACIEQGMANMTMASTATATAAPSAAAAAATAPTHGSEGGSIQDQRFVFKQKNGRAYQGVPALPRSGALALVTHANFTAEDSCVQLSLGRKRAHGLRITISVPVWIRKGTARLRALVNAHTYVVVAGEPGALTIRSNGAHGHAFINELGGFACDHHHHTEIVKVFKDVLSTYSDAAAQDMMAEWQGWVRPRSGYAPMATISRTSYSDMKKRYRAPTLEVHPPI